LAAKKKVRTTADVLPVIPEHTLTPSEVHQCLKHEVSKNYPPPMMVEWKESILKV
jgi:hypothetical protein